MKIVWTLIAFFLGILALRLGAAPFVAHAQADTPALYIEPGSTMLRKPGGTAQLPGKVVIDLRTGDIWGFPTMADAPYPIDTTRSAPPVSEPMYLGKFDFSKMSRPNP